MKSPWRVASGDLRVRLMGLFGESLRAYCSCVGAASARTISLRPAISKPVRRYTASAGSLSPATSTAIARDAEHYTHIPRCRQGRGTETGITERRADEEVVDERHEPAILHPEHERDDHVADRRGGLLDEPDSPEPRSESSTVKAASARARSST